MPSWRRRMSCWSGTIRATTAPASRYTPSTSRPTASPRASPPTGAPRRWPQPMPTAGWNGSAPCSARTPHWPARSPPAWPQSWAASRSRTSGWTSRTATGTGGTTPRTPTPSPPRPPWPPPWRTAVPRRSSGSGSSASRRPPVPAGCARWTCSCPASRPPASSRKDWSSPCPRSPRWPRCRPWTTPCPGWRKSTRCPPVACGSKSRWKRRS